MTVPEYQVAVPSTSSKNLCFTFLPIMEFGFLMIHSLWVIYFRQCNHTAPFQCPLVVAVSEVNTIGTFWHKTFSYSDLSL